MAFMLVSGGAVFVYAYVFILCFWLAFIELQF